MTRPLTLYLPLKIFEELHQTVDGRGKFCKVSKKALRDLLMDHSRALARLHDMQIVTEESYANSSTVRKARQG